MKIAFSKYHGTGNDFILIDCINDPEFRLTNEQISQLCNRRFGIGADGLILIYTHPTANFSMRYHNSDGSMSFCGNGARCAVKFAYTLGLFKDVATFEAHDGLHEATLNSNLVSLKMNDVKDINKDGQAYVINTGSPHYIDFTTDIQHKDIIETGRNIRYSAKYKEAGINVNLVEILQKNHLKMKTYERGVEDETYSCGTGAVATALAYAARENKDASEINIEVKGGQLSVKLKKEDERYHSIYLIGPATKVFEGIIEL